MKLSLLEVPDEVILARVCIQLVKLRLKHRREIDTAPSDLVRASSRELPPDGYTLLRFAMHSLAAHLSMGVSSRDWLDGVVERAMFGGVFRWIFFAGYKKNRNPYPRVTNRGVQNVDGARPQAKRKRARIE